MTCELDYQFGTHKEDNPNSFLLVIVLKIIMVLILNLKLKEPILFLLRAKWRVKLVSGDRLIWNGRQRLKKGIETMCFF